MKLYYLFLFLIVLLVPSCAENKHKYFLMESHQIRDFITETNHIHTQFFPQMNDDTYAVPSIDWINNEFTPALRKFYFKYNLYNEANNENDCEDLALYAEAVARILYHNDSAKIKECAISVGHFDYLLSIESHRIIMFVAHDEEKIKLIFYEPFAQQIIKDNNEITNHLVWNWEM